jgi:hypothetical protein
LPHWHRSQPRPWDQVITNNRFRVLSDFNDAAVLDRETGLVWEQSPDGVIQQTWFNAQSECNRKSVGARRVDGSPHDWLEGRGPSLCLIGAIDDATGKVVGALFVEAESTWGYFRLFSEIFHKHGLPQSVYADRHSVFWTDREPTIEEQLKNQRPTTEVGRGLQELGVTLIPAGSPQAKGRIERLWGTFQDRLVSELRRAGAKNPSQAQVVIERHLPEHNRQFSKPPAQWEPAWRKASSTQIEKALCFKQKRTVAKDHTVTFEGTLFQIPKQSPYRSYANKRIDVHVDCAPPVGEFSPRFEGGATGSFGFLNLHLVFLRG